ncbi:tRNA (adenosine(37)-N6)-dimethylallyltransferase MiaA [Gemmatimonadota bacterium]
MRPPILVIAGPTGVGKSEAAVIVAEELRGEVVSADSRQVYKGLEIGTAAPGRDLLERVPHHLVSVRDPLLSWSAGEFAVDAVRCLTEILGRSNLPIIVGGSGFYIRALTEGLFKEPPVDPVEKARVRAGLDDRLEKEGAGVLWAELTSIDPQWAERIPEADSQRIIRGLEVYELHGVPLSELQQSRTSKPLFEADWRQVLLERDREDLYQKLNARVVALLDSGWLEEAETLRSAGIAVDAPGLTGLGYDQLYRYLDGEIPYEEAVERIRKEHRNYAKRQLTWFRSLEAHRIPLGSGDGPEQTAAKILACWQE